MSKKKWLLLIIVGGVIAYLLISKVVPSWGAGIDNTLGPAVSGTITGIKSAIENSPVWQQYDVWFSGAFFSIVTFLLVWQGHNAFNKIRGIATTSAYKEAFGYQQQPSVTPAVIPSTPAPVAAPQVVAPPPTPAPTPAPAPTKEPES